jgi:predicted HicB family RNase H-like nuclease
MTYKKVKKPGEVSENRNRWTVNLRLPQEVFEGLELLAAQEQRSMHNVAVLILSAATKNMLAAERGADAGEGGEG